MATEQQQRRENPAWRSTSKSLRQAGHPGDPRRAGRPAQRPDHPAKDHPDHPTCPNRPGSLTSPAGPRGLLKHHQRPGRPLVVARRPPLPTGVPQVRPTRTRDRAPTICEVIAKGGLSGGVMARVFLSYAREDLAVAEESVGRMKAQGHEVFYDADLVVGDQWQERLLEQLRWADAMVCLITTAYVASTWCSAEVGIAIARGSRVMPVLVEAGLKHPLLTGIQSADYARDRGSAFRFVLVALRRIDSGTRGGWVDGRNPFPGLVPIDTDMSHVFFGRRKEISNLTEMLRSPGARVESGMLVVTGASGCGKSSLVRAGLLPIMLDEPGWWTLPPILPGSDPIGALARELTAEARRLGLGWQLPEVRSGLDRGSMIGIVDELLLAASESVHSRRRMLI